MPFVFSPIDLADVAQGQGGFVIQGEDGGDYAGSVASAGDVNGDGFNDVIIGASGAETRTGAAYVVFGKAGGFDAAIDLADVARGQGGFVILGEDRYDGAGTSVASARDINGDGFGDLIVGAYGADGAGTAKPYAGAAYVVFGKAGGFGAAIDLAAIALGQGGFVLQGEDGGDRAGISAASTSSATRRSAAWPASCAPRRTAAASGSRPTWTVTGWPTWCSTSGTRRKPRRTGSCCSATRPRRGLARCRPLCARHSVLRNDFGLAEACDRVTPQSYPVPRPGGGCRDAP